MLGVTLQRQMNPVNAHRETEEIDIAGVISIPVTMNAVQEGCRWWYLKGLSAS